MNESDFPLLRRVANRLPVLFCLVLFLVLPGGVHGITLTGANGKAVEFHSIESATEKGLTARMVPDGPVIGITWDKLDLEALATEHPEIHEAYLRAKEGVVMVLEMESKPDKPASGVGEKPRERYPGWFDVKSGKITFVLQLPPAKARGILLVSMGDFGEAFQMIAGHERGRPPWGEFQTKHHLALLSYDLDVDQIKGDPTEPEDFIRATKGSGKVVESALRELAAKAGQPEIADLPIAVYGSGRSGSAFAYNFVHHCPERILAAAVSKGAFYDAEPTPESARVPMLLIYGQYCNNHELLLSENYAQTVHAKAGPLLPNWTLAREFRGRGDPSLESDHVARKYLLETVALRLPPKADPPPSPADGEAEEKEKGEDGEKPEPTAPAKPELPELDRSKGLRGNLETLEALKITDASVPLSEDETFVPTDGFARLWKTFANGELEVPLPGAEQ